MKSPASRFAIIALGVLTTMAPPGCKDESTAPEQITGSGRIVSRQQSFDSFSSVRITGIGQVFLMQDTTQTFRLDADDNIIDRVTAGVAGGVLTVGIQQGSYSGITVNIFVSMKSVELLEISGAGGVTCVGPIRSDTITCRIIGAGSMTLSGTAAKEVIEILGAGDIHNFDLAAGECRVMLSGTGNIEVTPLQLLDATIAGVGNVVYAGDPLQIRQVITGVGSVRKKT